MSLNENPPARWPPKMGLKRLGGSRSGNLGVHAGELPADNDVTVGAERL